MFRTKRILTFIFTVSFTLSLFACSSQNSGASLSDLLDAGSSNDISSASTNESSASSSATNATLTTTTVTTSAISETKPDFSGEVSEIAEYGMGSRAFLLQQTDDLRTELLTSKLSSLEIESGLKSLAHADAFIKSEPTLTLSSALPLTKAFDGITAIELDNSSNITTRVDTIRDSIQALDTNMLATEIYAQIDTVKMKLETDLGSNASLAIQSLEDLKTAVTSIDKPETLLTLQNRILTMADLITNEGEAGAIKASNIATFESLKISERSQRETLLTEGLSVKKVLSTVEAEGVDVKTVNTRTKLFLSLLANGSADEVDSAATSLAISLRKTARATSDIESATTLTTAADSILDLIAN